MSEGGGGLTGRVGNALVAVRVMAEAGVIGPIRPDRLVKVLTTLARFGRSPAAGTISLAARYPGQTMIVDELGSLTFDEVHRRTNALAHALSDAGLKEGDGVGIMCRNHRGFIEATVAVSKLGGDALYLNTAFSGPQLADVAKREKPAAIIYDEEFAEPAEGGGPPAQALRGLARLRDHRRPDARRADRERGPQRRGGPVARGPRDHPHLGYDRHPEGRGPGQPAVDRAGDRTPLAHPAEDPADQPRGRAALSLLGLRPLHDGPHPRDHLRPAPEVRPGGGPGRGGAHARGGPRGGAGDVAAHPRAAGGDAPQVRRLVAQGGGRQRLGSSR